MSDPSHPALSIVIPVFNEEQNLPVLFGRLYAVLDALQRPYEVIFTNDGSADRSLDLLKAQHAARPDVTRVIDFNANYGQHMAIMAAFERVRGGTIVTLDADLYDATEPSLANLRVEHERGASVPFLVQEARGSETRTVRSTWQPKSTAAQPELTEAIGCSSRSHSTKRRPCRLGCGS